MKKLLFLLLCCASCVPDFGPPERLYRKEIKTSKINIQWFYYSLISNTTPDYIITSNASETDTVCLSSNILDVYFKHDTIFIDFKGKPFKYEQGDISISDQTLGYPITVIVLPEGKYSPTYFRPGSRL